jgi:hypothetical protein
METRVGSHRSRGVVIAGVYTVATPMTYWKIGTLPLFYQVVSDSQVAQ